MGFSWTENIAPGRNIRPSNLNEIRTNINTIYSTLGIHYTCPPETCGADWPDYWPVSGTRIIQTSYPQDLRDRTDYAYENLCPADKTLHYISDDPGHDIDHHITFYDTEHNDEFGDHRYGADTGEDVGDHGTHHLGFDAVHTPYYYGVHCPGDYVSEDAPYHSDDDSPHNSGDETGEDCIGYNSTAPTTEYFTHKGAEYGTHFNDEKTGDLDDHYWTHDFEYKDAADTPDDFNALSLQHGVHYNDEHTPYYDDDNYNELINDHYTHKGSYYVGNLGTHEGGYLIDHKISEDNDEWGTHRGLHDSVDKGTYYSGHDPGYYHYHNGAYCTEVE